MRCVVVYCNAVRELVNLMAHSHGNSYYHTHPRGLVYAVYSHDLATSISSLKCVFLSMQGLVQNRTWATRCWLLRLLMSYLLLLQCCVAAARV